MLIILKAGGELRGGFMRMLRNFLEICEFG